MRRLCLRLILAALLLGLGTVAWLWLAQRSRQQLRLPDGSTLVLARVTYGQRHVERVGRHLRDFLVPFVPENIARKLNCNYLALGDTNSLVVWLECDGITTGQALRLRLTTFDEHGCEFRITEPCDARFRTPGYALLAAEFGTFPRRAATIGLRVSESRATGGYALLGEFTFPNPSPRTFPTWRAEPLPVTKLVETVPITLAELKGGIYGRSSPPQLPLPGEDCGFLLKFRFGEPGKPGPAWSFEGVRGLSDAAGQTVAQGGYAGNRVSDHEYHVVVAGGLCLNEPVRVRAEFARERDFPSEEVWTVKNIPVPDESSASHIDATNTLRGVRLNVLGIIGAKCPGPDPRRSLASMPVLLVTASPLPADTAFKLIQVVDDRGSALTSGAQSSLSGTYVFGLPLRRETRSIDATLVVTRRLATEFIAQPTRMTAAEIQQLRKELGYQ